MMRSIGQIAATLLVVIVVAWFGLDFLGYDRGYVLSHVYRAGGQWVVLLAVVTAGVFLGRQLDHKIERARNARSSERPAL